MRNSRFEVRPSSGALGAELLGIDLSESLDAEGAAEIRQALNEHGVVFFRDQHLSPEQHIAFAERMGTININRFFKTVPGYPQIAEVRKEPAQTTNIGGGWHTDHSYDHPVFMLMPISRHISRAGPRRRASHFSTSFTRTRRDQSSKLVSSGKKALLRSGIIGRRGTMR